MIISKIIKLLASVFLTCSILSPEMVSATFFWNHDNDVRHRVCTIHLKECNSAVEICARWSGTNFCQKFANRCYLDIQNCNYATQYYPIDAKFCKDMPLNTRRQCSEQPPAVGGSPNGGQHNPLGGKPRHHRINTNNCNNIFIVSA